MGEGFSNFVANASGVLVRTALKSANYVAGSLGWQISKAGSAEFNDATIRGSLAVGTSPNPRIFVGNQIPATLDFSPDFSWQIAILWYFNATDYYWETIGNYVGGGGPFPVRGRGAYSSTAPGTGIVIHEFVQWQAGSLKTILYGSTSYSVQPAAWVFRNGFVTFQSDCGVDLSSGSQLIGNVVAYALDCSINSVVQSFTQVAWLAAGWSGALSYRQVASPARSVQLASNGIVLGTKVDGTKIFNIPAPFRPAVGVDIPVAINVMAGGAAQSPHINLATNGDATLWGCSAATNLGVSHVYALESP